MDPDRGLFRDVQRGLIHNRHGRRVRAPDSDHRLDVPGNADGCPRRDGDGLGTVRNRLGMCGYQSVRGPDRPEHCRRAADVGRVAQIRNDARIPGRRVPPRLSLRSQGAKRSRRESRRGRRLQHWLRVAGRRQDDVGTYRDPDSFLYRLRRLCLRGGQSPLVHHRTEHDHAGGLSRGRGLRPNSCRRNEPCVPRGLRQNGGARPDHRIRPGRLRWSWKTVRSSIRSSIR